MTTTLQRRYIFLLFCNEAIIGAYDTTVLAMDALKASHRRRSGVALDQTESLNILDGFPGFDLEDFSIDTVAGSYVISKTTPIVSLKSLGLEAVNVDAVAM